tara:strand:- start:80 stop:529 length:450 start_codon:yes stop_codon:yes gene_type:complete
LAALVGMAGAFAMTPAAIAELDARSEARLDLATLKARVAAAQQPQPPLLSPARTLRAGDATEARAKLASSLRRAAAGQGVLVEAIDPMTADKGLVRFSVRLSGNEKAVIALADEIERQDPVTRFADWRIEAVAQGQVRLSAQMIAPWQA